MKIEDKELVLKDLSGRVPYKVKAHVKCWSWFRYDSIESEGTVCYVAPYLNIINVITESEDINVVLGHSDYDIKPYLFPMSSMTEEQRKEYEDALTYHDYVEGGWTIAKLSDEEYIIPYWFVDFCNKNHLDYRGLIPKGLALDATGKNIY